MFAARVAGRCVAAVCCQQLASCVLAICITGMSVHIVRGAWGVALDLHKHFVPFVMAQLRIHLEYPVAWYPYCLCIPNPSVLLYVGSPL